ncbi:hypothetical protein FRC18_010562 [Serendipita sp. 400]|nr:hypothetical protein FRC18_010562 [Serendipita sp. 400]
MRRLIGSNNSGDPALPKAPNEVPREAGSRLARFHVELLVDSSLLLLGSMLGLPRAPLWLNPVVLHHTFSSRRMQSVISGRPLDVVVVSPPPPPALPQPITLNDLGIRSFSCSYRVVDSTDRSLKRRI